jgi:hypothetical protein
MFATKDGIYSFNGVKVTKSSVDITLEQTDSNDACASSLGDKYYLALRIDFDDDKQILCEQGNYVNNALVAIDVIDYSYQIVRGVDIKALVPMKTDMFEKMLVVFNTEHSDTIGQICETSTCYGEILPKFWGSGNLTQDYTLKMFTHLLVYADENVNFRIIFDDDSMDFTTYTSGLNEFNFKITGHIVRLEISSDNADADVKKVVLDYYDY